MADSNLATISITITPVKDAPVATNGSMTTTKNTPASGTVQASDVDGDALTFSISKAPRNGSVTLTNPGSGTFTYTPKANFTGSDSFIFKVSDGKSSATGTVSVTMNP